MYAAVTAKVRWHRFGQTAHLTGPAPGVLVLEPAASAKDIRHSADAHASPPEQLQRAVSLTVVVALEGGAASVPGAGLEWAGLSKRAVAGETAARLVASATEEAMAALHLRLAAVPGLASQFLSARQRRIQLIATRNVSAVAEAMALLLGRMPSDCQDRLSQQLGLPASTPVTNADTGELEAEEAEGHTRLEAVQRRLRVLLLQTVAAKHPSAEPVDCAANARKAG